MRISFLSFLLRCLWKDETFGLPPPPIHTTPCQPSTKCRPGTCPHWDAIPPLMCHPSPHRLVHSRWQQRRTWPLWPNLQLSLFDLRPLGLICVLPKKQDWLIQVPFSFTPNKQWFLLHFIILRVWCEDFFAKTPWFRPGVFVEQKCLKLNCPFWFHTFSCPRKKVQSNFQANFVSKSWNSNFALCFPGNFLEHNLRGARWTFRICLMFLFRR